MFIAPTTFIVDVFAPVEFDAKDEENKISRTNPIGAVDIDLERCVIGRDIDEITSDTRQELKLLTCSYS